MLKHLALALLLACLGLPASAPAAYVHPTAHMSEATGHHHQPADRELPAAQHHECIGCIAPLDIAHYRPVTAPDRAAEMRRRLGAMSGMNNRPSAPEPPPPRTLA